MQSCVLFVVNFSLTQTIYQPLVLVTLFTCPLPIMYTRALLSSALFLSLALHQFISICIYICTSKYSVCTAMRLAEVSSILSEPPFISSFNTLVEQVASQANKADEVTFYMDLLQLKIIYV